MTSQCPSINITTFAAHQADYVVDAFHVTWQSVMLLTSRQYRGEKTTLVVTKLGKTIIICRPLADVLRQFFTENCVNEAENRVFYRMLGMTRTTRSAVAGNYQLVPTCGAANEEVVWVMTHHLVHAERLENHLGLQFAVNGAPLFVTVQFCATSFLSNLRAADKVAHLQLELADFRDYCHGYPHAKVRPTDYQRRRRLQRQLMEYNQLLCLYQHEIVMKRAFEQKKLSQEERLVISRLGFRPFTPF